jgi:hypothetical protein
MIVQATIAARVEQHPCHGRFGWQAPLPQEVLARFLLEKATRRYEMS